MKNKVKALIIFFAVLSISLSGSYAQGEQTITEYLKEALPPQEGRRVVLDEATGLLTITDTASNHKLIRQLIRDWDVGPQQIRIEARFVEIKEKTLRDVGVEWFLDTDRRWYYDADSQWQWDARDPDQVSGLDFWIEGTDLTGTEIEARLKALEGKDRANLLSAPTVTTLSGQMANIELARVIPYASGFELTDTTTTGQDHFGLYETYDIEEKKTGIFLEVTPRVSKRSKIITLELHPKVSEVTRQVPITDSAQFPAYLGWPVVETRSTQTRISIRSGRTIAIGGLIKDDEETTKRKVPLVGDIPLLGNLFRWEQVNREKTNLIVFLTATIVTPDGEEIK
jgi:type II secretory pathway component GspD/PulD (secretin)